MPGSLPFTANDIISVTGRRKGRVAEQLAIVRAIITYLPLYGPIIGIMHLHRLCDWLAQIAHESADFAYTSEIGGSRRRYAPWFGRGLIQLTWLANYQAFVRWLWAVVDKITGRKSPDYSTARYRDMVAEMPTAFLTAIFYWQWRKLNQYADSDDFRRQTKVINGGYNGWDDRVKLQGRFGLMLLGYKIERNAYKKFQKANGLRQTDRYDEDTQAKMRELLHAAPPITLEEPGTPKPGPDLTQLQEIVMTLITSLLGLFGGRKSAGILGGLIAMLTGASTGVIDTSEAPVGLDVLKGDWGGIAGALSAGIMLIAQNVGNMVKAKAAASPATPVEGENVHAPDLDRDGTIDGKEVSAAITRAMTGKALDDDPQAYADTITAVMAGGLTSVNAGIVAGLDLGCLLRDRFHSSKTMGADAKTK